MTHQDFLDFSHNVYPAWTYVRINPAQTVVFGTDGGFVTVDEATGASRASTAHEITAASLKVLGKIA